MKNAKNNTVLRVSSGLNWSVIRSVVLQLCRSALISWADMVLAPSVAGLFKWRQFEPEVILLAVAGTCVFHCSYRDVEELLAERGISVDQVTLWRYRGVLCAGVGAAPA